MSAPTTPSADLPALRVRGLHKRFGHHEVLRGVDLDVEAGSVSAVLGPSGCGKTTLLRIVAGFERPNAGTVDIDGVEVASARADVAAERRRVGVVPQEGALFPHLSVAGNVGFGLPRGAESRRRVGEVLELVGLPGFEGRRPNELSGGQQHRVALARALAPRPTLIVLDEPFSSLDTALRGQVRAEVFAALRASATTAVLVTHDQQEALSMADRVAVLFAGRIAQHGTPVELYDAPATLEVATFVGEAIVLPGTARGEIVECALGRLRARPTAAGTADGPVHLVVRPEQVRLTAGPAARPNGRVVAREWFGHDALVTVALDAGPTVRARLSAHDVAAIGEPVEVAADAALAYPA